MIQVKYECDPSQNGPNFSKVKEISKIVLNSNSIKNARIVFIFGKDELLARLKKKFFKKNHYTDVIAFRLNDYEEKSIEGEVYISLPRCRDNARTFKEPYEKEISRLIIHGCLHLLGFNDKTEQEKNKMIKMENKFLDDFNWHTIFLD